MEPLYDRSGRVYGWIDGRTDGWIVNLDGKHVAFVEGDSVYNRRGQHLGWWLRDHICNHAGEVVVFLRDATGLGVTTPTLGTTPRRPTIETVPTRATRGIRPIKVTNKRAMWAQAVPF
jgi:hypothetical protein